VATSRRRERELARRRYERRRLREQQQRAQRRRRNTVIGAVVGTLAVIGGIIGLVVGLSGGSGQSAIASRSTASPTPAGTSATPTAAPAAAPTHCKPISPNPPAPGQPKIPPVGKAPKTLVVKDVKKGHGPAAKVGDSLKVSYIGVSCSSGKVFDATYKDGGQPFTVSPLGHASVITGWNKGLVGVRAGGVRELVIPPALGYGAAGQPPAIAPNDVLIFLVTVQSVHA
jgi:peptidylprolyl isomerase